MIPGTLDWRVLAPQIVHGRRPTADDGHVVNDRPRSVPPLYPKVARARVCVVEIKLTAPSIYPRPAKSVSVLVPDRDERCGHKLPVNKYTHIGNKHVHQGDLAMQRQPQWARGKLTRAHTVRDKSLGACFPIRKSRAGVCTKYEVLATPEGQKRQKDDWWCEFHGGIIIPCMVQTSTDQTEQLGRLGWARGSVIWCQHY